MADCSIVANNVIRLILLAALIMPSVQFSVFTFGLLFRISTPVLGQGSTKEVPQKKNL